MSKLNEIEVVSEMFANSEVLYTNLANIYRKMFISLTSVGFTEEQAIQIVTSLPIFSTSK